jgi:hypothetical protein
MKDNFQMDFKLIKVATLATKAASIYVCDYSVGIFD